MFVNKRRPNFIIVALFPTFSFLSHSCVSNSRFFISTEGKVTVRAQTAVAEGEEITQSYFPTQKGNVLRRKTIRDLWYFTCTCPRCEDSTELGTYLSSVHCRACKGGYLLQTEIENLTSDLIHFTRCLSSSVTFLKLIRYLP